MLKASTGEPQRRGAPRATYRKGDFADADGRSNSTKCKQGSTEPWRWHTRRFDSERARDPVWIPGEIGHSTTQVFALAVTAGDVAHSRMAWSPVRST
jgi:hypothetical protein